MTSVGIAEATRTSFQHEALFYGDDDEFLTGTAGFIDEGLEGGESVLVAVSGRQIALLRGVLGRDSARVDFLDMTEAGRNPARIIPVWAEFLRTRMRDGRGVRGIGEPIYPSRRPAELVECQKHEALLNLAFESSGDWKLLCPYNLTTLPGDVIAEARRSHPVLVGRRGRVISADYRPWDMPDAVYQEPLPPPPSNASPAFFVGPKSLGELRHIVSAHAAEFGLADDRLDDLLLAVHEIATNSIRYGGGSGTFRIWPERGALVCEVADSGRLDDPLAGRRPPPLDATGGRGLWISNNLCDLVQIRTDASGTLVRLHMWETG